MKIDFTETEIEQIQDMLDYAIGEGYFDQFKSRYKEESKQTYETILRKLDIGE